MRGWLHRERRLAGALLASLALVTACSSDAKVDADRPTSTTTTTPTTSAPVSSMVDGTITDCRRPSGSSPATFDESAGVYAAQSVTAPGDHELRFDIVQWLSGDDANKAYERETGDSSGAPNDYYIANESTKMRSAPVAEDASIYILDNPNDAVSLTLVTWDRLQEHLPSALEGDTYWLTFSGGTIREVCQQYRP